MSASRERFCPFDLTWFTDEQVGPDGPCPRCGGVLVLIEYSYRGVVEIVLDPERTTVHLPPEEST